MAFFQESSRALQVRGQELANNVAANPDGGRADALNGGRKHKRELEPEDQPMHANPFRRGPRPSNADQPAPRPAAPRAADPLDVEDLLVDGSLHATINADGTLRPRREAVRDREEHIDLLKQREWGLDADRVRQDAELMAVKFPRFRLVQAKADVTYHGRTAAVAGQLHWLGRFRVHSGNLYTVVLAYPDGYPQAPMACHVIDPALPPLTPHRYADGHLCLYSNDHGGRGAGFESGTTTAVTYAAWTAAWLHAYEVWARAGRWPVLKGLP
jgi:hypothetical protein